MFACQVAMLFEKRDGAGMVRVFVFFHLPTFCLSSFMVRGGVMSWAALVAEKGFNKTSAQILNELQTTCCD